MTPSFLLVALLGGDAPTIVVDVDALALPQAQAEQLHGELMTRLVESGHPVGSAGAITVRLTGGGARVHVEVQHGSASWTRDVEGNGALLRLAAIHAALDLLAKVDAVADPDPALASTPERSVVLEVDEAASTWVPEAIAALVDADNVVKPSPEGARWRACLRKAGDRPTLAVVPVDSSCPEGVVSDALASDLVAALAVARSDAAAIPEPTPTPEPESDPESEPTSIEVTAKPTPPPRTPVWSGALGVGVGVQARLRDAEALVLLHGDARHRSGAMITVRAELAPSVTDPLRVVDTFVTAGAGYAFVPRPRLRLEVVATAGLLVHGYTLADDGAARADFTASLPLGLAIALTRRLELGISATTGFTPRPRRHLVGTEVLWQRDRWRFAALVSLRVVLGRKLAAQKSAEGA